MSLTTKTKSGVVKLAKDVNKNDGPFYCTFCDEEMILRKGMVKVPHFAHKKGSNCPYSTGETFEHEKAKLDLLLSAKKMDIKANVEVKISEHVRADVLLDFGDRKVAVEFQKSGMSVEQCQERLKNYRETGIPVIWIFLIDDLRGNFILKKSISTKIEYFSKLFNNEYFDSLNNEKHDENVIYVLESNEKIGIWRLINSYYKIYRRWEKIGEVSLLDKDKFYTLPHYNLWKVKDKYLLGPNILDMEGKQIFDITDSTGGIDYLSKIDDNGIKFNNDFLTWESVLEHFEGLYIYSYYYIDGYSYFEYKKLFIPDFLFKLRENKEEIKKEGNVLEDFL